MLRNHPCEGCESVRPKGHRFYWVGFLTSKALPNLRKGQIELNYERLSLDSKR